MKESDNIKILLLAYQNCQTDGRVQEIIKCAQMLGETTLITYQDPNLSGEYKLILSGNGKRKYLPFLLKAYKAIRHEKPNVIFMVNNYCSPILWMTRKNKKIYKIYDSAELYITKDVGKISLKNRIGGILRIIEKNSLKYSNTIIAANIERASIMKDYYSLKNIPIVFDNIHRIDDIYSEEKCNEKYLHLFIDNVFCAVYGGGINRTRFTYELAETFHKLGENYQLLIMGAATEQERQLFAEFVSNNSISNVKYLGMLPRNEWRYFLSKADISISAFVQDTPNNIYCASGKLYEGLFEGTPVLTSENPPFKRLCEAYGVGVSTNNFYNGVLELQKNYTMYKSNVKDYISNLNYRDRVKNLYIKILDEMGIKTNV